MASLLLHRRAWTKLATTKLPQRFYSTAAAAARVADHGWNQQGGLDAYRQSTDKAWKHVKDETLSTQSLSNLLKNSIPTIRVKQFLSSQECTRLADVVSTHKIGAYNEDVFPAIGSVGITQFDFKQDKKGYFAAVKEARVLQQRFIDEAGVHILERVRGAIEQVARMPVRLATEQDREYFAGLLRVINTSTLIHADYAPYDAPSWNIGQILSQVTWNVLLRQVHGGETIIYNRLWRGKEDDETFKKPAPSYGYQPIAVENVAFKVIPAIEGDLTLMNSRNFHEVRPLDRPDQESRYTVSSFVGLLPSSAGEPELVLWS